MDDRSLVSQLLSTARRRFLALLVLDQSALALTIGMGGAILLLLTGTQILDWYWIVLLTFGSLGIGLYRVRKGVPSTYQLAQRIDRRLNLADALSTATFFSAPEAHGDPAIRQRQHQEAENIARTIDVRAGVPYQRPRFAYAALGVTLVAVGLFAVRYAVTGSLSLKPSLVQMAFDTFFPPQPQLAKAEKKQPNRYKSPTEENSSDQPTTQAEQKPDAELQPVDSPDQQNSQAADSKTPNKDGKQAEPQAEKPGDNADKGDKSNSANDADQQDSKDSKQNGDKQQNGKQDSKQSSQNDSSSLMDKLKDAMSNMMNKMKPSQKQGENSQQNAQNGKQDGKADKNQKQSAKNQDQKSNPDSKSDQQSDQSDQQQSAEAKGNEKSSDKNASPDSKSGVGSADGDKTAKEAEQLNAMGKISEILGKRSQNVTGEVMVEVGSSKQQLKTPWAQKQATHVEAGSEIHRDEVPLMYQQFVQQYFEEIHKSPAPAPAKKNN